MVRIGRRAIISFPNFGHWRVRWHLGWTGRMPETAALPDRWYNTPNIHLCTIHDFVALCAAMEVEIEKALAINDKGKAISIPNHWLANLVGEQGLFVLRKRD
jgi:methionine biosynthesis protein MetW